MFSLCLITPVQSRVQLWLSWVPAPGCHYVTLGWSLGAHGARGCSGAWAALSPILVQGHAMFTSRMGANSSHYQSQCSPLASLPTWELPPKAAGSWIPDFDWKHWGDESEFLLTSPNTSLLFMIGNDSHQKCVAGHNLNVSSNSGNFQEGRTANIRMCPPVTNQRSCWFNSFAQKNN